MKSIGKALCINTCGLENELKAYSMYDVIDFNMENKEFIVINELGQKKSYSILRFAGAIIKDTFKRSPEKNKKIQSNLAVSLGHIK